MKSNGDYACLEQENDQASTVPEDADDSRDTIAVDTVIDEEDWEEVKARFTKTS